MTNNTNTYACEIITTQSWRATQILEKYTSHFIWKDCVWEVVGDRTKLQHIDPHSIGHYCVSFLFSWAAQPGTWGPASLGTGFLYRILSPTGLVSKLTDFRSSSSYILVQRPLLLVGVTIALIQPIHGQGYNSDISRPDAPVICTGSFPILTARPGRRSIYNMCLSSSRVQFKNDPEYSTRDEILAAEIIFQKFSRSSLELFSYIFLSYPLVWWCPLPIFPSICNCFFSPSLTYFSLPIVIPISCLCIFIICIRASIIIFVILKPWSYLYSCILCYKPII